MATKDRILAAIGHQPGQTDHELTTTLFGPERAQQAVNQACRQLEARGKMIRMRRADGLIGNYPGDTKQDHHPDPDLIPSPDWISEDQVKEAVAHWLRDAGWRIETLSFGRERGIDIFATKDDQRWIIEAKGQGSLPPMRVNYFLCVLGEILQHMNDRNARYSIALPDTPQFLRLWARLPKVAKERTSITAIFVSTNGGITHET